MQLSTIWTSKVWFICLIFAQTHFQAQPSKPLIYYIQSVTSLMLTVKRRPIKCSNKDDELSLCCYFNLLTMFCSFCLCLVQVLGKSPANTIIWTEVFLTTFIRRNSMFLYCMHICPLIASRTPSHIHGLVRHTEIIATDNGSSTLCKHVFFPTGLDHYCTEYNSIAPQTTILNLSIISVHSRSHTPFLFESLCPSLVPLSLFFLSHYIKQMAQLK